MTCAGCPGSDGFESHQHMRWGGREGGGVADWHSARSDLARVTGSGANLLQPRWVVVVVEVAEEVGALLCMEGLKKRLEKELSGIIFCISKRQRRQKDRRPFLCLTQ